MTRLLGCRAAVEATEPGPDADHRDDAVRVLDRRVEGGHPAPRVADQRRATDAQRVEDGDDVSPGRELDVVGRGPAVAARVVDGRRDSRPRRAAGPMRIPGPKVGDARVEEDDRRSARPRRRPRRRPPGTSISMSDMPSGYRPRGLQLRPYIDMTGPPTGWIADTAAGPLRLLEIHLAVGQGMEPVDRWDRAPTAR